MTTILGFCCCCAEAGKFAAARTIPEASVVNISGLIFIVQFLRSRFYWVSAVIYDHCLPPDGFDLRQWSWQKATRRQEERGAEPARAASPRRCPRWGPKDDVTARRRHVCFARNSRHMRARSAAITIWNVDRVGRPPERATRRSVSDSGEMVQRTGVASAGLWWPSWRRLLLLLFGGAGRSTFLRNLVEVVEDIHASLKREAAK